MEAAAAAMTVRRANNFLALGFSSSCSDAGWMEFAVCKIYDKMNKIYGRIDGWINENQYVERKKTPEHKLYVHCKLVGICTHHLLSRL